MSHCDAIRVTQAFRRDEKAGKGFENITAKLAGNQDGKRDFSTRLCPNNRSASQGKGVGRGQERCTKKRLTLEGTGGERGARGRQRDRLKVLTSFATSIAAVFPPPAFAVDTRFDRPPFPRVLSAPHHEPNSMVPPRETIHPPGRLLRLPLGGILLVQHLDHLHQTVVAGLVHVAFPPDLLRQLRPEEAQEHAIQEPRVVVGGRRVRGPCASSDYLMLVRT